MKKSIMLLVCGLVMSLTVAAQVKDRPPFGQDKVYIGASFSNLGLSYTGCEKWNFGGQVKGGYLFEDNWMVTGNIGYDYRQHGYNDFSLGAGLRYYIEQNGLYLGAGANYVHHHSYDDLLPTVQLGYAFFLNRTVTLEPEVYYNQSLKNHSDYSGFGIRIGLGIYFE